MQPSYAFKMQGIKCNHHMHLKCKEYAARLHFMQKMQKKGKEIDAMHNNFISEMQPSHF
jgi:hypothetical protein